MNIKALLKLFEILGGIDTTLELCKIAVEIIKWVFRRIQNVVHKIQNARKK